MRCVKKLDLETMDSQLQFTQALPIILKPHRKVLFQADGTCFFPKKKTSYPFIPLV